MLHSKEIRGLPHSEQSWSKFDSSNCSKNADNFIFIPELSDVGPLESDIQPEDIITSNTFFDNTPSSPSVQKSFFFEVVDQIPDTNEIHLKIMSSTTRYYSTSQVLNYKFQISKSLTHFFSAQRVIPRRIQQKYFNLIRKKITGAYACGIHLSQAFKEIVISKAPKVKKDTTVDFTNDKSAHANLLFCRWQYGRTKEVFSNRLGISYSSETYHAARDATSILHLGNKHMYRKTLSNFRVTTSTNLCTKKKQEKRFERSCRRVFNRTKSQPGIDHSPSDRLAIAKRYHLLFLPSQSLRQKLTSHLLIPLPHHRLYAQLHLIIQFRIMFIPHKYRDIIPTEPLYSTPDGVFIVPGSREWFTYMSTLEKKIRADITFQRTWEKALAHQRPESAKKELEIARVQKERAGYLGISVKHLRVRERETLLLTGFNDRYYEGNGEISLSTSNIMLILQSKSKYVRKCLLKYSSPEYLQKYTKHRKAHTPEDDSYILEETQALEFRPNKRDVDHNSNLLSYHVSIKQKRLRSVPIFIEDSTIYKFKLVLINCINRSQVPF
ncbi:hypothetical protein RIR_jg12093.t1 [Rhizophagus irregularis DAOM 181602=DAOM 197198]|nr:hypothetical protein RIR_jg12093.t1 [Rhizophagus irregularis DAOM 181602=DAOM 197198]